MRALILIAATGCRSLLGFEELAPPETPTPPNDVATPADDGAPDDTLTEPMLDALVCPATYDLTVAGSTSRYRFVANQSIPWLTANNRCGDDGQHLIVLDNEGELSAINVIAGAGERWVGLSNRANGGTAYLPVTDQPTTFPPLTTPPWATGQPQQGETNCVAINDNGQLLSLSCGNGRTYICECDGFASDATNF